MALDGEAMVRGGCILKHQWFSIHGELERIAAYQLPISEGIVNPKYAPLAWKLLADVHRQPLLFVLGMGGYESPLVKFCKAARWTLVTVPFFFRIVHPFAFLRNIRVLRRSRLRRVALDLLALSGLGWIACKAAQRLQPGPAASPSISCEKVAAFLTGSTRSGNAARIGFLDRPRRLLRPGYAVSAGPGTISSLARQAAGTDIGGQCSLTRQCPGTSSSAPCALARSSIAFPPPRTPPQWPPATRVLQDGLADIIVSNQSSAAWCGA